jgi:two-component sensor histidine kinase
MKKSTTENGKKIQQLEAALNEKINLLQEVYHRVKNNFQVIISLINLQIETIVDPLAKKILIESNTRIKTMVLVHEMLYQSANLAEIEMKKYINDLLGYPISAYSISTDQIKLIVDVDNVSLPVDSATLCGLIINELVSNAIKYAFPKSKSGNINVSLKSLDNTIQLRVQDNGIGFADTFDMKSEKTLGMRLILNLSKQLDGTVNVTNNPGVDFTITFIHNIS